MLNRLDPAARAHFWFLPKLRGLAQQLSQAVKSLCESFYLDFGSRNAINSSLSSAKTRPRFN